MDELLAPEDLPKWVPGRILDRSDDLGWKGVVTRTYGYRGQDVEIPAMRDFLLVSYRAGVTPMERRFDGRWTQTTCGPGSVSMLTRSQKSHWHWTEDVKVTHVYLTQEFVSNVACEVAGRPVAEVRLADVLRADDPVMSAVVNAIAVEAQEAGLGGPLYVEALARQLVIHLLRRYANVTLELRARPGELTASQRRVVLELIESNLDCNLALRQMAAEVKMGACTFARRFRQTMGVAPHAYVTDRRLELARRLLAESAEPVKEVAVRCGFSDQSHLTRLFAKRFGAPPGAYRKDTAGQQPKHRCRKDTAGQQLQHQ